MLTLVVGTRARCNAALVLLLVASACSSTSRVERASEGSSEQAPSALTPAEARAEKAAATRRAAARGSDGAFTSEGGPSSGSQASPRQGPLRGSVPIGVRYIDAESVEAAATLFGLNADVGDPRVYAEKLVDHVNATGGLGGRRLVPVYHPVDAAELAVSSAAAEQRACTALAEDGHVFAVVSPGPTNQAFTDCMSTKRVPVINDSYNYFPPSYMKRYGPHFYFPSGMDASRSARVFIDALRAQGFFGPSYKLGLVRLDTVYHDAVRTESLGPALAARGLRIHEEAILANAQDASGFSNAVLRFRSAGVTNVIFIESAGQMALGFTDRAEDQGYRPRYGFSSHAGLFGISDNTVPAQLARSVGVGWVPASDAMGPRGVEIGDAGQTCLELLRKAGAEVATPGAITFALWACDTFLFLKAAMDRSPEPTVASLSAGAAAIGTAHRSPSTFSARFDAGRRDGVAAVRNLAYNTSCRCFRWVGEPYAIR